MQKKTTTHQTPARRRPQQERSLHKVGLILEATVLLLENGDIDSLTTNAVAEKAGVSIGTFYQYFAGKQALLHALAQREVEGLATRVTAVMTVAPAPPIEERSRMIVGAVLDAYGGRRRAHRLLLEHALTRGTGTRLNRLYSSIANLLVNESVGANAGTRRQITSAEAFVLTHAVAGVMRALVAMPEPKLKRRDVEAALARLMTGFMEKHSP